MGEQGPERAPVLLERAARPGRRGLPADRSRDGAEADEGLSKGVRDLFPSACMHADF